MGTDKSGRSIGVIGAGNLGRALVTGLLKSKTVSGKNIILSDPAYSSLTAFQKQGVKTTGKNSDATKADVVILAVKPSIAPMILREIKNELPKKKMNFPKIHYLFLQSEDFP